jgi:hypothetical protein
VHAEPSHWLHEISMFRNCSSPFLAWTNYPHYKLGVLILSWLILISCGGTLEVQSFFCFCNGYLWLVSPWQTKELIKLWTVPQRDML